MAGTGRGHDRPRLALCHEWLNDRHGSEKTFEAMAEEFPAADLFALTLDARARFSFGGRAVRTTALDRLGPLRRRRAVQLPLMPLAWRYASRETYDIVLTSSHACVKGFGPGRRAYHLSYCYTPARYLWLPSVDGRRPQGPVAGWVAGRLRSWDRAAASWVDEFAAISEAVAERIEQCYDRPARVIHPPVDVVHYSPSVQIAPTVTALAVSRMIPYKQLDLAIRACHRAGCPLVVAGSGPDEARLRALAARIGADVEFVIAPDDAALRDLYRRAGVLVFPAEEDFGIVVVEAQACGTPVVALGRGGTIDTVVDGRTGILVPEQDEELFADAIRRVLSGVFPAARCRANAERFSEARFRGELRAWLDRAASSLGFDPEPFEAAS